MVIIMATIVEYLLCAFSICILYRLRRMTKVTQLVRSE